MDNLVLVEKDVIPNENSFITSLKDSYSIYRSLYEKTEAMRPDIQTEWKYYGKKNGWLLKHLAAKRNIFFLVIYDGFFKISITLGDQAISQIRSSDDIDANVKECINKSKKYAEGTAVLLSVNSESDVEQAIQLITHKLF